MPKTMPLSPFEVRKPGKIALGEIPINQYVGDINREIATFGRDRMKRIYRDMLILREFENMLDLIKREGSYNGVKYDHKGPAHLSIGQESAAVGQAVSLEVEDLIFGSHRSHGEILAKCLGAIYKLKETDLQAVMEGYMGGSILRVIEQHNPGGNPIEAAENFILYGTLAEIFARANGFNRGLGGSMHTFFAPLGSYPNNAIVGGSCDIAVGASLFKRINRVPGVVVANIGDASLGCGPVWEGLMLAAMDQYKTLWAPDLGGSPPMMLNIFNNFYGMGGQPRGETMGFRYAARVGAGVNPWNMHAECVDGFNPLAVADATSRKRKLLLEGRGPVLLETITYRLSGHSPSDASSYRSKEELADFRDADSLWSYRDYLVENAVLSSEDAAQMHAEVVGRMVATLKLAIDDTISPRVDGQFIESVMFSNRRREHDADPEPELLQPIEENSRVKAIARKARRGIDSEGKKLPASKVYAYRDAIFEALLHRFALDPTMVAYGEENRDWGGAFAVYRGLTELLPYHRLFNSPISEAAIVGSAIGYALSGGRAVVELMYCDFLGRAGDEVFNQLPKWQAMSGGELTLPVVLRISVGNKYGAQHSQDWSALLSHIPGLKIMFPATPYDAKGMMNLALSGSDPVIFLESQKLYGVGEEFEEGGVPEGYYEIEEGEPCIKREGRDLTIATIGATLYEAIRAADILKEHHSIEAEVIDLRFINPLNYDLLIESVRKTGRLLLASDASERGSFLHTVASRITLSALDYLDAPPVVVGARNWITPPAELDSLFFPSAEWIIDGINENILPIPGWKRKSNQCFRDLLRRDRGGV